MDSDQSQEAAIARLQLHFNLFIQDLNFPPGFDPVEWLEEWLHSPIAALANARPVDYLGRQDGEQEILKLWSLMKSSSFA